jgi:programmed cell death 6-interacting protein
VPTKKSKAIRFGPALLPYITNAYAEDATLYEHDCQALDDLRAEAIQLPDVLTISTIDRLFMYYSQLVFLGTRFPLDVSQIAHTLKQTSLMLPLDDCPC